MNNPDEWERLKDRCPFPAHFIQCGQEFRSMARAYAWGLRESKTTITIFSHQDIVFYDDELPEKLESLFREKEKVGWVGVIGNTVRSQGCWWELPDKSLLRGRVIQSDKTKRKKKRRVLDFGRYTGEAAQLDGLFLATNLHDWRFLDIPGIHFFDLLCCREAEERGLKNYILDTEMEHFSWGETTSAGFQENAEIYRRHISGTATLPYVGD